MERTLTRTRFAIALCASALGCGSPDPASQRTPDRAPPPVIDRGTTQIEARQLPEPAITLPLERAFRLLAPGEGARAELRYALHAREVVSSLVLRLSSRQLRAGTWSAWTTLLPITTSMRLGRTAQDALRCVPEPIAAATEPAPGTEPYLAAWAPLVGRTFTLGVDPRGQLGAVVAGPAAGGASDAAIVEDLVQRWLAVRVPVPAEPVGIGASWRVTTVMRQRPAVVKQTATYRLVARTPARWTIAVEVDRIGETQEIVDPEIPRGVRVEVVALVRRLAGTVEVDPGAALPVAGNLTVTSTLHLRTYNRTEVAQDEIFEDTGTVQIVTRAADGAPR